MVSSHAHEPELDDSLLLRALAGSPDLLAIIDVSSRLLWANQAAENFFGVSNEEAVGLTGLDLVHPDDAEISALSLLSVQSKEVGSPIEVRLRSADGWRLVELVGAPLSDGPEPLVVLSIRDLTDRRRYEVANDDVAKFRSLVHNAAMLMLLVAPDGTVESASASVTRLLGHDSELLEGGPLADIVEPRDRSVLSAAFARAADAPPGANAATTVEVALRHRAGGDPAPFELTIVNLLDDPTVGGFVVTGHDLDARKKVEAELLNTLSLLSATLDSTNDGILVVDLAGTVTTMNRRFTEMWRIPEAVRRSNDDARLLASVVEQLVDPGAFTAKVAELYARPEATSHDVLDFADGRVFERWSQPQYVDGEIVGRVWSFHDVTARKRLEEELAHQALHDALTGLANQSLFRDRVEHALARRERTQDVVAVLFIDLDNFKAVNDSLGHATGDELLVAVSERIEECLRSSDTAARLGGDEFVILVECGTEQDVINVASRLLSELDATFRLGSTDVPIRASMGVAFGDAPDASCDQLLRNADLAMYTAKRRGRGRYEVFEAEMHATAVERLVLEAELRHAVERGEIELHYQSIVDLASGAVAAVEALARWRHPDRGLLGAEVFIPLAEETGLIDEIGAQVLDMACAQLAAWHRSGHARPSVRMSVNLAARQLLAPGLAAQIRDALARHGVDAGALILEITEGAMMHDTGAAIANLTALKALGVQLAVDDFGTGYSSLAYLNEFPVDIIKIDKSFIDGIDAGAPPASGPDRALLAHAIIRLAQTLGLAIVAEGVERVTQHSRLVDLGCHLAQGYLYGRPAEAGIMSF